MTAIVPEIRTATFQVAAVGSNETKAIFNIREGDLIIAMWQILKTQLGSGTSETTEIGDGVDPNGFGTNTEMNAEGTVGALIQLGTPGSGLGYECPHLSKIKDTIDIVYTAGDAAGAAPAWKIYMVVIPGSRA